RPVAAAVRVAAIPRPADGDGLLTGAGTGEGGLVVLATTTETAAELARAEVTARLSVVLRSG
ncbi:MAG: hypothetical protein M3P48_10700, partial [Actinomycetota bacterium]|nr:hypothetical protein [Actinomycetota bacterium]